MSKFDEQAEKFAALLLRAIERIAYQTGKKRELVREELSQKIGRSSSALDFWIYRKHIPTRKEELEKLAGAIAELNGWEDANECQEFLISGNYHSPDPLIQKLFPYFSPQAVERKQDDPPLPKLLPPFVVGVPIQYPCQFFGREHELRRIFKAIESPLLQNIAITGAQRSGKTSLLHYLRKITRTGSTFLRKDQFHNWLGRPSIYEWVFVDFQDTRTHTQEGLFRSILNRLRLPVPPQCTLAHFIDTLADNIFNPTVILMDEIKIALEISDFTQQFWWGLRSLATNLTEGKLGFIISSQKEPTELFVQSGRPSPFFNIFGHLAPLGPLEPDHARALVNNSTVKFQPAAIDWILQTSQNWPALLQILSQVHLMALEENSTQDESWKIEGLQRIAPYRHLLNNQ